MIREELREAKKLLTKMKNKIEKSKGQKIYALSKDMSETYYASKKQDEHLKKAFWNLQSNLKSILMFKELADSIESKYPQFAERIMDIYGATIEEATKAMNLQREIEEAEKLLEANQAQNAVRELIKTEKREVELKKFNDFLHTLRTWTEPKIKNGSVYINGKKIQEDNEVGVIIGNGKKIHNMHAYIETDSKTGEKFIALTNYTQWKKSRLCIIDEVKNIPPEIMAYQKEE
ncbi:MAG: hypothetical protein A3F91_09585 [Flavobacteria bacterium RIFCSPLOWO2_12_FULL_35_11]|nr:MAG: hypothetical protein A3F91_09585 [Flavobacteria bacterium RIFCSPLOWO2_12_FULL_35_11]